MITLSVQEAFEGVEPQAIAGLASAARSVRFSRVTSDSREVKPGCAFVAVKGSSQDGHAYIDQAISDGALVVLGEEPCRWDLSGAVYVQVENSRRTLARLAAELEGNPSASLLMVGVTGTSGKTTTTFLIESILKAAGHRVGLIGTVLFRLGDQGYPSTHTTPGPVELQRLLSRMKEDGCTAAVMEVSSHALKQYRADGIRFDGVVFTNLSPEHLDFHKTMDDYFQSKARLFRDFVEQSLQAGKRPVAAINGEDAYGRILLEELRGHVRPGVSVVAYGIGSGVDVSGENLKVNLAGIQGEAGGVTIRSPLSGTFNASNILAAVSVTRKLGVSADHIARGLAALQGVPGRLERVETTSGIHVLVDYAHKPDALEKVLRALRDVKGQERLITVFGCGGDRDRVKRPVMGRIACELSDHVVITSDNPRTEKPDAIIGEILQGVQGFAHFEVEPDRARAIQKAISRAQVGDLVLIAGKGHEDYQILGTQKVHFDDREVARECLKGRE